MCRVTVTIAYRVLNKRNNVIPGWYLHLHKAVLYLARKTPIGHQFFVVYFSQPVLFLRNTLFFLSEKHTRPHQQQNLPLVLSM